MYPLLKEKSFFSYSEHFPFLFTFTLGQKLLSVHDAVRSGNVLELEAMVKRGGSLNELDAENKFTPLHWACHSGALEVKFSYLHISSALAK